MTVDLAEALCADSEAGVTLVAMAADGLLTSKESRGPDGRRCRVHPVRPAHPVRRAQLRRPARV